MPCFLVLVTYFSGTGPLDHEDIVTTLFVAIETSAIGESGGRKLPIQLSHQLFPLGGERTVVQSTPPLGVNRLRNQTHAERRADTVHRVKSRGAIGT
jgi:hypothetical protein